MSHSGTPKKHKKNRKRDNSYDEEEGQSHKRHKHGDDSDAIVEDEELETEVAVSVSDLLPPAKIIDHLKELRAFIDERGKNRRVNAKHLKVLATEFIKTKGINDGEKVVVSMMHYLKISLRMNCISLDTGLRAMSDFLDRGETVTAFPDYPSRPGTLLSLYAKNHNISMGVGTFKDISDRLKHDVRGKEETERELEENNKRFLAELEEFEKTHLEAGDLTQQQAEFLKNSIVRYQKKLYPKPRVLKASKSNGKKGSAERAPYRTPFELFCAANPEKYKDYPEEKRLKKLQKKFDNLDDVTRNMFVNMSLTL